MHRSTAEQIRSRVRLIVTMTVVLAQTIVCQFLSESTIPAGARASALGNAYATEYTDISSMYWNPGALSLLEKHSVFVDVFREWNGGPLGGTIAVPVRFGPGKFLGIGVSAAEITRPSNGDAVRVPLYNVVVGSAVPLLSTLSLGVRVGLQHARESESNMWALSSVLGILYAPSHQISYSIVYSGIGLGIRPVHAQALKLEKASLPRNLQLGMSMRFPSTSAERFITMMVANDKTFGEPGMTYKGGLEVIVKKFLALRAGYIVTPALSGARYGLGFTMGQFQIDYAVSPSLELQRFHHVTLSFVFGDERKKIED